jgi:hypothetical protein
MIDEIRTLSMNDSVPIKMGYMDAHCYFMGQLSNIISELIPMRKKFPDEVQHEILSLAISLKVLITDDMSDDKAREILVACVRGYNYMLEQFVLYK